MFSVIRQGGETCSFIQASESVRGSSLLGDPLQLIRYINRASSGELITLYGQRHGAYGHRNHGVACKHSVTDLARHDDYSLGTLTRLNVTSSLQVVNVTSTGSPRLIESWG